MSTMSNLATLEMNGKTMDYCKTFCDKIKAATKVRVQEKAPQHIQPGKRVILIVGDLNP